MPADSPSPGPLQLCEQHGFAHAVYISWPHDISDRARQIVLKIYSSLESSFRNFPGLRGKTVFIDEKRLNAGFAWDPQLRSRLARSAVTLVVLVPKYFYSEYCAIEWGITADLEARRIPKHEQRTCFIPIPLFPVDELDPPSEVGAIQFVREFEQLLVYGRRVENHPSWNRLIENLRRLVFDVIRAVCATERDWEADERVARLRTPFEFTWKKPPPPSQAPPFPTMRSVERR